MTWSEDSAGYTSAGKYASLSESGNYYILYIKNMPLSNYRYHNGKKMSLVTNKSLLLSTCINLTSATGASWKGNIYIDNIKLKTASRTQSVTFNTKDYKEIVIINGQGNAVDYKLTKPMK